MLDFSVVTSVYKNDKTEYVRAAFDSMLVNQSVKPNEIIIIRDGFVSDDLEEFLKEYERKYSDVVRIIRLDSNKGLGNALMVGVECARYEYIARMDSDDICMPDRFFKQISFFESNSDVDIVGGQISEFVKMPDNIIGKRNVPVSNADIYDYMKSRCGFNHMTVMFKKQSVIEAGNYQDWFWNEDYYLWVRMMIKKCKFANLSDILVNVRSGVEQYARRGGKRYFESEKGIKKLMLDNQIISKFEYYFYVAQRYIIQVLLPNKMRGWVYRMFARKK
ncbi:MAG: glycosyltransferase [Bacteroidales bacterium]|nr:glycosyltransferase [Bacteroidales bacterium]